jgi:hypothetical protein
MKDERREVGSSRLREERGRLLYLYALTSRISIALATIVHSWWSQHVAAHASLIALSDQDTIGNLTFYNSLIVITLGAFRFTSRRAKRPDSTHWCGPKDFRLTRQ